MNPRSGRTIPLYFKVSPEEKEIIDVQPMLSERRVSASFLHLHSWQGCNIIQIGL